MSLDRFVYWESTQPSKEELQKLLEDYIGEGGKVEFEKDRFTVTLNGNYSSPFKRLVEGHKRGGIEGDERWFEVHVGTDNIDIITRQADEFTNVVAEGFYKLCLRYYRAAPDKKFVGNPLTER